MTKESQKSVERDILKNFIDVRNKSLKVKLKPVEFREAPDCVAINTRGTLFGIELTSIGKEHPDLEFYRKIGVLPNELSIGSNFHAYDVLKMTIDKKERIRNSKHFDERVRDRTILVIDWYFDNPSSEISQFFTKDSFPDFEYYGFKEIWIYEIEYAEKMRNPDAYVITQLHPNMNKIFKLTQ